MKKKSAKAMIPPKLTTDWSKVPIRILMLGIVVKLLRGLNSLKVLSPLMFFMLGNCYKKLATTTVKSSQFQASLR